MRRGPLVFNTRKTEEHVAFGTDALLSRLVEVGKLTWEQVASHFLTLMSWRYRFVIPPLEVLKIFADTFKDHPPGESLRAAARYVHDCMQDPGLFSGPEPTDPPIPVSVRVFQSWVGVIAELLVEISQDESYSEDRVEHLIGWCLTEMIPTFPKSANEQLQARLGEITARSVIARGVIRASAVSNIQKANHALTAMARTLGVSDDEYLKIVSEVIDGTD